MANPYKVLKADVLDVITESPTIKTFHIKPEEPIEFATGQFIELTVPGVGEAPFTPSSSHYEKDEMDVTIMKAGFVTEAVILLTIVTLFKLISDQHSQAIPPPEVKV